jgi:hypothetical protein
MGGGHLDGKRTWLRDDALKFRRSLRGCFAESLTTIITLSTFGRFFLLILFVHGEEPFVELASMVEKSTDPDPNAMIVRIMASRQATENLFKTPQQSGYLQPSRHWDMNSSSAIG